MSGLLRPTRRVVLPRALPGARRNRPAELRRPQPAERPRHPAASLNPSRAQLRATAAGLLSAALRAAEPGPLVREHLKLSGRTLEAGGVSHALGRGRIVLVAVGKAAVEMARAAEAQLGARLSSGL